MKTRRTSLQLGFVYSIKCSVTTGGWRRLRAACARRLLPLLLLLTLPALAQAQFAYTTNNGTISITYGYCPVGAVTIPDTIDGLPVNGIGDEAFEECSSLTNVTIPKSVTDIGSWAFHGCTSLTTITVDALNTVYSSVDGVLFDKSQTRLIQYPLGKAGGYTIPNSVTSIEGECGHVCNSFYGAFADCTSLTNITIPNSVTSIGDAAFFGCTSLRTELLLVEGGEHVNSRAVGWMDYRKTVTAFVREQLK